jgi:transposase
MVDLDATLGEQLLDVAVGKPKAQVPADGEHDDIRWEAVAGEGRPRSGSRARAAASHTGSLPAQPRSKRTQHCAFGWLGRFRRLSKDYEFLPATSEAVIYLAMIQILTRRLANK